MSGSGAGVAFLTKAAIAPDDRHPMTAGLSSAVGAVTPADGALSERPLITYTAANPISADSATIHRAFWAVPTPFAAIWYLLSFQADGVTRV